MIQISTLTYTHKHTNTQTNVHLNTERRKRCKIEKKPLRHQTEAGWRRPHTALSSRQCFAARQCPQYMHTVQIRKKPIPSSCHQIVAGRRRPHTALSSRPWFAARQYPAAQTPAPQIYIGKHNGHCSVFDLTRNK